MIQRSERFFAAKSPALPTRTLVTRALAIGALLLITPVSAFGEEAAAESAETSVDAHAVFKQLKSFEGTWKGSAKGEGEDEMEETPGAVHEFRVASAGTVVMETMNQGTDHEMINMYHLDGDELRLTHYCAGDNQPHMMLDRKASTPEKLIFTFVGGTNLDPEVDHHIHGVEISVKDENRILSSWIGYGGGKQTGVMNFNLAR